jgi:hypothetical protein
MLGPTPAPQGAIASTPHVYGAPLTGATLATLGMVAFGLVALMPTAFDRVSLFRTVIVLALATGGMFGMLIGYVAVSTRVEISPEGLVVVAPGWRACPYPPVRQIRLNWDEVRAVHHRTEHYRIGLLPIRLPVEVYAIETAHEWIVLGSYYLWNLEPVLIDIANRADCPWREDGDLGVGLFRTLRGHGAPWPRALGAQAGR